ncbi:hypothetical protein R5R35_013677 [Gryllus longicercus]|uniref:Uncharacterized protein n=1 Tax=Gryllus longicercus TaxID=2509291 RepID=A0AAN9VNN5_9ORTH
MPVESPPPPPFRASTSLANSCPSPRVLNASHARHYSSGAPINALGVVCPAPPSPRPPQPRFTTPPPPPTSLYGTECTAPAARPSAHAERARGGVACACRESRVGPGRQLVKLGARTFYRPRYRD